MKTEIGNGVFYRGDCFEVMRDLPDGCVDMVLCDLPYGTTQNKWDSVLPLEPLWREYWRLCRGAIVLTAAQPFASALVMSAIENFQYDWIWKKSKITGVLNAKRQPCRQHESVLVFGVLPAPYHAQGLQLYGRQTKQGRSSENYGERKAESYTQEFTNWPRSVLEIASEGKTVHPTQKPVALFEYMIRTYTTEGMTVLDNTAGSGTTAIAAENAGRRWICIERDPDYYAKAIERVAAHVGQFPESMF